MNRPLLRKWTARSACGALLLGSTIAPGAGAPREAITGSIQHVLLISIDGMHALTTKAVGMLEGQSPATNNIAGIGEIFSGPAIGQLFNLPGLPPNDPRTPDIIVTPNIGVTYSGSTKKLAEHGGFSHDDTNVMMLLANPHFSAETVTSPVETMQIAPTILMALGLNPGALQSVQMEHTQVLPDVPF